jgi:hypothetical protein
LTAVAGNKDAKSESAQRRIQLALRDRDLSQRLRGALVDEPAFRGWPVDCCLEMPDVTLPGVIVLDCAVLDGLGCEIPHPERVVLITHREPRDLARAWDAGIVSVVYEDEPLSTAMLAVMAARFRAVGHTH